MLGTASLEELRHHMIPNLEQNYLLSRMALLADCNLLDEVPQVLGFFSLTPGDVNDVTALPYVQPDLDLRALLDFLSVSEVTAPGTTFEWKSRPTAMPIVTAGQRAVFAEQSDVFQAFGQTNVDLRRIVFLPLEARDVISATQHTAARVLGAQFANQKISIQTAAPASSMVVISQTHYPAWKAYVDGAPAKIWRANYAFQALQVPAGQHQVQLVYEDKKLYVGVLLSALGLTACLIIWLLARFRKHGVVSLLGADQGCA